MSCSGKSSVLKSLIFLIFVNVSETSISDKEGVNHFDYQVETLAVQIGNLFVFEEARCLVLVSEGRPFESFNFDRIPKISLSLEAPFSDTCDLVNMLTNALSFGCQGYIVQLQDPSRFLKAWHSALRITMNRISNPKILLLPKSSENYFEADALYSLRESELFENILAATVVDIFEGSFMNISLSTNNFFVQVGEKGRNPSILLDFWSFKYGFQNGANLFPDKIKNLKGKVLRHATWTYPPYGIFDPPDGTEVRIALEFCKMYNCRLNLITDDFMWGSVYDNGTGDGVLGLVYTDKADVGTSGLYLWPREYFFLNYPTPYLYSGVTCLVPKPTRLSEWRTPFLPFDVKLWILITSALLVAAFAFWAITNLAAKYTRFSTEILNKRQFLTIPDSLVRTLGLAVLQTPSSRLLGDSPTRPLFTAFELLFLLITACYSAELSSYLTIPMFNAPIDTFHDLYESGMTWVADHDAWVYSLLDATDHEVQVVASKFKKFNSRELQVMSESGVVAIGLERLPAGHFPEEPHITEKVISNSHIMKENLYGAPVMTVLQKGSPYMELYSTHIHRILNAGLLLLWEGEVARSYLSTRKQLAFHEATTMHTSSEPVVLRLAHVQGAFMVLGSGIFLSILVLISELLKFKLCK